MDARARGAPASDRPFEPMTIPRRAVGPHDVLIDIAFCGLCHTDVHCVRDWPSARFPCVPGHEIVGTVSEIGAQVRPFRVGDVVGVGCMVDSCRTCPECRAGQEQFCENGNTQTYNSPTPDAPGHTLGGYSQRIVVNEDFVLAIRHPRDQLAAVAPLLCAGITTYSAFRQWKVGAGTRVGIVGIGGLGHVGIRIARALGAHVTAFTTHEGKRADAMALGAQEVVVSRDAEQMEGRAETLDFILDTVAVGHDLNAYLAMLVRDGSMVLVGVPNAPHEPVDARTLFRRRRRLSGSLIGGIAETQEVLDFCAEHRIVAEVEMVRADQIDDAYERMIRGDVKYRFVLDAATL